MARVAANNRVYFSRKEWKKLIYHYKRFWRGRLAIVPELSQVELSVSNTREKRSLTWEDAAYVISQLSFVEDERLAKRYERMSTHVNSMCATADEVRIAWLVCAPIGDPSEICETAYNILHHPGEY